MASKRDFYISLQECDTTVNNICDLSVPKGAEWEVLSIWAQLETSNAGAGTRQMTMWVFSSSGCAATDEIFQLGVPATQDSQLTVEHVFFPGANQTTDAYDGAYPISIPSLVLPESYTIRIEESDSQDTDADNLLVRMLTKVTRVVSLDTSS